ncbi:MULTISPECIES: hypothetical protein [Microcystis]|nr:MULTISPECIES: hypothetical protein [Microcystis]
MAVTAAKIIVVKDDWLFWFLCGNEVYTDSFFFQNSPKSFAQ